MPFTLAHAAAILPLRRSCRSLGWGPGLVFGSMAPDLAHQLPGVGGRLETHSLQGLLQIDTPAAFLMAILWTWLCAPRIHRLPGCGHIQGRETPNPTFSVINTIVAGSIGGSTHLAWDAFTHAESPLVAGTALSATVYRGEHGVLPLVSLLWFASTFVGIGLLGLWARRACHETGSRLRDILVSRPW